MRNIPVPFEYHNKTYTGELCKVSGGGDNSTFYLSVNGYHWGQLFYIDQSPAMGFAPARNSGWHFTSSNKHLEHLSEFFGSVVISWYDCNDCL